MSKLTLSEIESIANAPSVDANWVKVGLDTGGIAAGGLRVFKTLQQEVERMGLPTMVKRAGSYGLVYIDPLVEVRSAGLPPILYGQVDEEVARRILKEHVLGKQLVDDHVVAPRHEHPDKTGEVTHILLRDTSGNGDHRAEMFQHAFREALAKRGKKAEIQVVRALDLGIYENGMAVQLLPSGVTFTNVLMPDVDRIVDQAVLGDEAPADLIERKPEQQVRIVTRNCGHLDPESLSDSLLHGVYRGLAKALQNKPEEVLSQMRESGLRGRGGAGFPTWLKWDLTRKAEGAQKYVICNGDEGDPGAFMDRLVLESDPHAVLEGLIVSAYCIGASQGYFYIRAEYPLAIERIQNALNDARMAGLLGENILGSGFSFDAKVRLGAGAFVCGEETALIASIEGKRGAPEPRPPFPSEKGLWGCPTSINNVETLANIGFILDSGAEAYAAHGMEKSKGTKVFAVTGKVRNPQLVEVPMGTTLREVIFDICGGILDDVDFKAVQTGGPSGGVIPEKLLDTPVSYENMAELGSIMGSGGMLVMDVNDCMVDVAKFYLKFCVDESCGKCAPCRVGGYQMLQLLEKVSRGRGEAADLEMMQMICHSMQMASLCGLGQTAPNPVLSTLRYFRPEYEAYIEGGPSYARKQKRRREGKEKPQPSAAG